MIRFLLLLLFASSAFGQCSGYDTLRAGRISAYAAAAKPNSVWIIGDSHVERLSGAYAQGPVYFAGIAGATWATIRDCIPWGAIGAKTPSKIILMGGVNDANAGACCDAGGNVTPTWANVMMTAIQYARNITPNVVLATDPPPESAAVIDAYRVHQSARMLYYLATLDWTIFGWASNPGPFPFVDQYGLMGTGGNPASLGYSGGRYVPAGSTLDNVHFPHAGIVTIYGNLQ